MKATSVTERNDQVAATTVPPVDGFELGVLLRAAYFPVRRCGNAQFGQFEANGDQFVLLKLLADGGPMNQLELVKRGGYDPATTTNMLKQLETRGHISREPDPDDGRAKIVRLTAAGRVQHKKLWKASSAARNQLWSSVRPKDRKVVCDTLRRIAAEMERLQVEFDAD